MNKKNYRMLSYTRCPSGIYENKLAHSMHLAYSVDGGDYIPLNNNCGVLYVKASENDDGLLAAKCLAKPFLFKLSNEGYGIVGIRIEPDGTADEASKGKIVFFTTLDLLFYTEHDLIDLKTENHINIVQCNYDVAAKKYVIKWQDDKNNSFEASFGDIDTIKIEPQPIESIEHELISTDIPNALPVNNLAIPSETAEKLIERLTVPFNTGVSIPERLAVSSEEDIQNLKIEYLYSDGSSSMKPIIWKTQSIDWTKEGIYKTEGEVNQASYSFPVAIDRADPCIFKWQGKYHFIATNDMNGNNSLSVRGADKIEHLVTAKEHEIINTGMYAHIKKYLWAPEFHVINDDLYIFFAASPEDFGQIRCHLMKLKRNGNICKKTDWEEPVPVLDRNGLILSQKGITLDMTYFEIKNKHYVSWAQRDYTPADMGSWLYLAEINPNEPWKLISEPLLLSKPDYSWANNHTYVEEGAYPLIKDEKLYLTFSGALVNYTYCVGVLSINVNDDLMEISNWKKANYPLLNTFSVPGEYGPGHNMYVQDDDGMVWNIYHARHGKEGPRCSGIRRVHFRKDGFPVLDMTSEKDISDKFRKINIEVLVRPHKEQAGKRT